MLQIDNSKYSFELTQNGNVLLFCNNENVTTELNFNIVIDMAYMIDRLNKERETIKQNIIKQLTEEQEKYKNLGLREVSNNGHNIRSQIYYDKSCSFETAAKIVENNFEKAL